MSRNQKDGNAGGKSLLLDSSVGAVLGMIMTILLIFGVSVLLVSGTVPETMQDSFIIVSVILGSALSGFYCAGKQGSGVITAGVLSAAAYVILLLIGTMMFKSGGKSGSETVLTIREIIASVAGGCFGGVLRLHKKSRKSRLRR